MKDAVNEFITAYNDCIAKVEEVTASGADLHGETSLTSLERTLKSYATTANGTNGGIYKLLSDIGITTAAPDGDNLSTDTYKLELDEEKFMKALEENPDSVQSLLAGENGVLSMMENTIEQSLKASVGFFDVKTSTLDSDIKKMEDEIEYRVHIVRKKALDDVKEARAQGDLSENFEYYAAKKFKNQNESRIRYLQRMIKTATVISEESADDEAGVNNTVEVKYEDDGSTEKIKLVTTVRGDSLEGLISIESPLGKAILGHKAGDRVEVVVNSNISYWIEILSIENTDDSGDKIMSF